MKTHPVLVGITLVVFVAILALAVLIGTGQFNISAGPADVGVKVTPNILIPVASQHFFSGETNCQIRLVDSSSGAFLIHYTVEYAGPPTFKGGNGYTGPWIEQRTTTYDCKRFNWADPAFPAPFSFQGRAAGTYTMKISYFDRNNAQLGKTETMTSQFRTPVTTTTTSSTSSTSTTATTQGSGSSTSTTLAVTTTTIPSPPTSTTLGTETDCTSNASVDNSQCKKATPDLGEADPLAGQFVLFGIDFGIPNWLAVVISLVGLFVIGFAIERARGKA